MKQKYILPIAFAIILASAVFVSALSYQTEKEWVVPIHKGWNLVSSGLVLGNGAYSLSSTTCNPDIIEGGYFYIHPKNIQEVTSIEDPENKYFAYNLREVSINGDKMLTLDTLYNKDEIIKALGIPESELDDLEKLDNEYSDFYQGALSIWVISESDCQLSYKIRANSVDKLVNTFSTEWFNSMPYTSVVNDRTLEIYPTLMQGWNFMSITPGLIETGTLDKVKGNCNIKKAYMYESDKQRWVNVAMSYQFSESDAFKGIIIDVENQCDLRI